MGLHGAYNADAELQIELVGDADMPLFSDAQVTNLIAAYFVRYADNAADFHLGL